MLSAPVQFSNTIEQVSNIKLFVKTFNRLFFLNYVTIVHTLSTHSRFRRIDTRQVGVNE